MSFPYRGSSLLSKIIKTVGHGLYVILIRYVCSATRICIFKPGDTVLMYVRRLLPMICIFKFNKTCDYNVTFGGTYYSM